MFKKGQHEKPGCIRWGHMLTVSGQDTEELHIQALEEQIDEQEGRCVNGCESIKEFGYLLLGPKGPLYEYDKPAFGFKGNFQPE